MEYFAGFTEDSWSELFLAVAAIGLAMAALLIGMGIVIKKLPGSYSNYVSSCIIGAVILLPAYLLFRQWYFLPAYALALAGICALGASLALALFRKNSPAAHEAKKKSAVVVLLIPAGLLIAFFIIAVAGMAL